MRCRVTAGKIAFLAIGLLLGGATGAALVEFLRARASASRASRIPPRPLSTLATDPHAADATDGIGRGGSADRPIVEESPASVAIERRTTLLPAMTATIDAIDGTDGTEAAEMADGIDGTGVAHGTGAAHGTEATDGRGRWPGTPHQPVFRLSSPPGRADDVGVSVTSSRQAVPVSGGADPVMTALHASETAAAMRAQAPVDVPVGVPVAHAPVERVMVAAATGGAAAAAGGTAIAGVLPPPDGTAEPSTPTDAPEEATAPTDPCVEARRLSEERCELATRAREGAAAAEAELRAVQKAHEEHEAGATAAAVAADARAVRDAKDIAQGRFRSARAVATTTDEVEAAARAWLLEINGINLQAREALGALSRERALAKEIASRLDRLSLEAEAARIAAGTAEAACLAGREALADCEEREAAGPRGHMAVLPAADTEVATPVGTDGGGPTLGTTGSPRIFRLLRGDRSAMTEMVAALGGDDAAERRRWQLAIADLVDAIVADSIAASALEFPAGHHLWGSFTREQNREIAGALSSLGYRFDGLGAWVDLRVPSQRDLSLAMGYAGIDPMRLRTWPTQDQMTELYRDVEVAAAEHVSGAAGDLTLGELVSMLGRRADGLAEVWNHWGHIRPLLLEDA
ncbi:MAG: hypothetical protein ACXWWU_10540 [Candidatus Limnocylindria bacterium]